MSTRIHNGIEWLRERGSWPLLAAIILLSTVTMLLIDDKGMARPITLVALALLGVALVLGCLFAFPYAGVWRDDGATGQAAAEAAAAEAAAKAASAAPPRDPAFINDIRTMLISIVVGVFALVTIYLTYVSAQAAAQSAEATEEQQKFDRLSSSAELMGSNNAGIRLVGVASLSKLIDDRGVDPVEGYRALAVFVRDSQSTHWTKDKQSYWEGFLQRDAKLRSRTPPQTGENDVHVGVGSLRKRTPDVQSALSVVASGRHRPPGYRADFRDASLQGAALGHAWLPGALFSGAHLDHLDVRTDAGPYANFAKAEFKGAKLYAAYFHNAELGEAHFDPPHARQMTDLRYAQFRGASAVGAHFEGADLRDAVFTSFKARPTILRAAHFNSRAELPTNLEGAVFDGADLTGADFSGAKLRGASFKGAVLTGARFTDADLSGAHLEGAVLKEVNFDWATLTGVTYNPKTIWPAGFYAPADRTVLE
jgi:uncharacterized protein YjbI with pentapeptide repeats